MRLFFGIELPTSLRVEVARAQSLLRPVGADVRWTDPAAAHATLKFLGEVPAASLPDLDREAAMAVEACARVRLQLHGIGWFPSGRRARVLWVGLRGELDALAHLHRRLDAGLAGLGFVADRRPFRPHVTIGRVRSTRAIDQLLEAAAHHRDLDLGGFEVHAVTLLQSRLSRSGARYEPVASYSLAG